MSVNVGAQVYPPSCAVSDDSDAPGIARKVITPILHNLLKPARAWFANHRRDICKWLVVGLGIGVVACAASFGLAYLLSYFGVAGALAAVSAIGPGSVGAFISAVLWGPISAYFRWKEQTQFKPYLGELPSLFLVNITSVVALLPIGGLPFGLGFLSKISNIVAMTLPMVATFLPSLLDQLNLGGRRWLFVAIACMLLKNVITVCCFGVVRAGVFLFVNIPAVIVLFILYYLDKQSGSFIPSVCASVGVSLISLVAAFIL
jgi:hypothetical protein